VPQFKKVWEPLVEIWGFKFFSFFHCKNLENLPQTLVAVINSNLFAFTTENCWYQIFPLLHCLILHKYSAVNHKRLYSCFHKTCFLCFLQMHNKSISGSLCYVIKKGKGNAKSEERHDVPYCGTHKSEQLCHGVCLLCGTNHSVAQAFEWKLSMR
jgi:hypothetical protein